MTIWNRARLFHHILFNMGDLHLVLHALNLSTLNGGILIMISRRASLFDGRLPSPKLPSWAFATVYLRPGRLEGPTPSGWSGRRQEGSVSWAICAHLACFSRVYSQGSLPNNWNGCSECGERVKGQAGLTCGQDDTPVLVDSNSRLWRGK